MRVHTEEQPRDAVFDITGIKYLREIKATLLLRANAYHVWAFAVSPIYSSLYTPAWVVNLGSGIGVQFVAFVLGVIFNTIVTASLCEMISTIPSSGGVVGFGRVALGHLVGFLCGVIECVGLFTSTAIAAILWGQYIQDTFNTSEKFLILWSTLTLACSCSVIIVGGRKMWDFILITGVLSTFILLLYLISAMVGGNFDDNAFQQSLPTDDLINGHHSAVVDTDRVWFSGGMSAWYIALPNSFWMMGGIECIGVIGEEVINVTYSLMMKSYGQSFIISGCRHPWQCRGARWSGLYVDTSPLFSQRSRVPPCHQALVR
jgi:amino acid transporter